MTHVVVLGAGIAGVPAAYALKSRLGPQVEVTVISDRDYFHFVPSNPWIAMGWRERADVAFPIAPFLQEHGIRFVHGQVQRIQPDSIRIDLENGEPVFYDYLLIATGAEGDFDAIPGLAERTHAVLHIDQAEATYAAYKDFLRAPGPIVIGAAQGASILGPVYEYAFLVDADLKRRNMRGRAPITLVTPEPWPGHLGLGSIGANRAAVEAALADNHIHILCNARTLRVDANTILIAELGPNGKERSRYELPYAFSVYWPAFRGVAGVRAADGLVNPQGLVEVDEYLRNRQFHNVFAAGICVAREAVDRTAPDVGAPDSVYSIQNEIGTAVYNIVASIHGETLVSHVPQRAKWLSDMGDSGAAYLAGPQVPLRDINWMRQGRWVHQAKVDFEKYFINRIRLRGSGQLSAAVSRIANVMSQAMDSRAADGAVPATARAPGGRLDLALGRDDQFELRALARTLGLPPDQLAADLLAAAVSDARSYLGEARVEKLERARRELRVEELPERQPGVAFHGGGT